MTEAAWLHTGKVYHCRNFPKVHAFTMPVFYVSVDVEKAESLGHSFFSMNRWNLLSLYDRDYGSPTVQRRKSKGDHLEWARRCFAEANIDFEPRRIWLQTFPRVMGYVFNPVSFWYCYDGNDVLRSVLCEVNNTFGETHNYIVRHPDLAPIKKGDRFHAEKIFHVSPFFPVKGRYEFKFQGDPLGSIEGENRVDVLYYETESRKPTLVTYIQGGRRPLDGPNTRRALFRNPFLTFKVITLIHVHALFIYLKGAKFFGKPAPPPQQTS